MQDQADSIQKVSSLRGASVFGENGKSLAKVKELMIDTKSGRIAYAVLAAEDKSRRSTKLFAVPWEALLVLPIRRQTH